MNRTHIISVLTVAAILAAVTAWGYRQGQNALLMGLTGPSTNEVYYYEDGTPKADPAIVGTWQNAANPQWFKVYYDDYDCDGYWWGKEWSEDEDVMEEDLPFHGNGWFRWRKEGKQIRELYMMDISGAVVPKAWLYKVKKDSLLLYPENAKNRIDRFGRVHENN